MIEAVIVDAVRTPLGRGKPNGALAGVHAVDLLAHALAALLERTGIDGALVDDVIVGAVSQVGEQGLNVARRGALAAGYPERVPATTVDRQCGSSQQAISFAAQGVLAGSYDLVVVGGVESMSRVPMGSSAGLASDLDGERLTARYPEGLVPQGVAAELIAARWKLSRAQLDEFGLRSQELAAAARAAGLFETVRAPCGWSAPMRASERLPWSVSLRYVRRSSTSTGPNAFRRSSGRSRRARHRSSPMARRPS
jgi:acetyl-CoA acyltransferase